MYPSKKDSLFGVFVKNFKEKLEAQGAVFDKTVVIRGKTASSFVKLFRYLTYYFKALLYGTFFKSDIIYVHFLTHNSPLILILGIVFKKKIVVNIHGSDIMKYQDNSYLRKINSLAIRYCIKVVVPSKYFKEVVKETFPSMGSEKIIVYPSGGINRKVFDSHDSSKMSKTEKTIRLGMTSRIDLNKGWDVFLLAVAELVKKGYNVSGFVIGQGNKEKELLDLRKTLSLEDKIEFLGLQPQKDISMCYEEIDAFIFPTLLNESLGLVGLEAMSCGLPVIASNIGAPSSYVLDAVNGYLFEPNNPEDLAIKIASFEKLLPDDQLEMKRSAIKTAKEYDSDKVALDFYSELETIC